jgi:hypothetical protein
MIGIGIGLRQKRTSGSNVSITATGGTITYSGGRTIHTFTSSGTFTVLTAPSGATVEALVVAGGGGGGNYAGGGGGAGGLLYTAAKSISATAYAITVGSGGACAPNAEGSSATNGNNSVFDTLTAIGGGKGAGLYNAANSGGSGGGGGAFTQLEGSGTIGQGFAGGATGNNGGGGGGGSSQVGTQGPNDNNAKGGDGASYSITGTSQFYAGGGGGGTGLSSASSGGNGGGGNGSNSGGILAINGTANTGGGGGGSWFVTGNTSGNGGSGIVIISYPT